MRKYIVALVALAAGCRAPIAGGGCCPCDGPPTSPPPSFCLAPRDAPLPPSPAPTADDQRADTLLAQMTLDEKITMMRGASGTMQGVPRLNVPSLLLTDGPAGI